MARTFRDRKTIMDGFRDWEWTRETIKFINISAGIGRKKEKNQDNYCSTRRIDCLLQLYFIKLIALYRTVVLVKRFFFFFTH